MFRLAYVARTLPDALSLVYWDDLITSWRDIGDDIAAKKGWAIVDGVRVKLLHDDGDAWDAPNRELAGSVGAGVGGSGE